MKSSVLILGFLLQAVSFGWITDFETAKQTAKTEHKYILLNFSGSDWCGPCIEMNKAIFDTELFNKYAEKNLVLLNADFPRLKKHALSHAQEKKNEQLAEIYNKKGIFPLTVLLTADGVPIKRWEGWPRLSANEFITQLQSIANANH